MLSNHPRSSGNLCCSTHTLLNFSFTAPSLGPGFQLTGLFRASLMLSSVTLALVLTRLRRRSPASSLSLGMTSRVAVVEFLPDASPGWSANSSGSPLWSSQGCDMLRLVYSDSEPFGPESLCYRRAPTRLLSCRA